MYVKLKNKVVEQYPYSISQLKQDNKDTSFPAEMSDERLAEWNIFPVIKTDYPQVDYTKDVVEGELKLIGNTWTQTWIVTNKEQVEVDAIATQLRADAYRNEADPLFFKTQRGEITQQEWINKVNEIKTRFPKGN